MRNHEAHVVRRPAQTLFACLVVLLVTACSQKPASTEIAVTSVTNSELSAIAGKRILFAHQSVGNDILDGVRLLSTGSAVTLNVVETRQPEPGQSGLFHFKAGENGKPLAKLEDFEKTVSAVAQQGLDVAFVKLCYIDFEQGTDAGAVAQSYIDVISRLSDRFPQTRFVAVTAPLTTVQTGPKAWIKTMLGRTPGGYADNARRREFNERLRQHFTAGNLMDVAAWEADRNAGREFGGAPLQTLDPALTSDGGHLNEAGKRVIGAQFVKFLAASRGS